MNEITEKKESLFAYEGCIRTHTGIYFNVAKPDINLINIEDIAHALSYMPRFGGHLPRFYSVAEHCLNCCSLAPLEHKLAALLHDGSEGLGLLDLPTPVKQQLPEYYKFEDGIMRLIAEKYGFKYPLHPVVKDIDKEMLHVEWHGIMLGESGYNLPIQDPIKVKQKFLDTFNSLKKQHENN